MHRIILKNLFLLVISLLIAGCAGSQSRVETTTSIAKPDVAVPATVPQTNVAAGMQQPHAIEKSATPERLVDAKLGEEEFLPVDPDVHKSNSAAVIDEIDAAQTVSELVSLRRRSISLNVLQNYDKRITKIDLLPLAAPAAVECLRQLDVSSLGLTDDDLSPLSRLQLEDLNLDHNNLHTLSVVEKMTTLLILNVSRNPLDSSAFDRLSHLPHLRWLNVGNTTLTDNNLKQLAPLHGLLYLNCVGCKISYGALKAFLSNRPQCQIEAGQRPNVAMNLFGKLDSQIQHHQYQDAESAIKLQISKWEKSHSTEDDSITWAYVLIGKCEEGQHHSALAIAAFDTAKRLYLQHASSPDTFWERDALDEYARFQESSNNWSDAIKLRLLREEIANSQQSSVVSLANSWLISQACNYRLLGSDYTHIQEYRRAAKMYDHSASQFEKLGHSFSLQVIVDKLDEGDSFKSAKEAKESRACYLRAEQLLALAEKFEDKAEVQGLKSRISRSLSSP